MHAADKGGAAIIQYLLEKGADVDARNKVRWICWRDWQTSILTISWLLACTISGKFARKDRRHPRATGARRGAARCRRRGHIIHCAHDQFFLASADVTCEKHEYSVVAAKGSRVRWVGRASRVSDPIGRAVHVVGDWIGAKHGVGRKSIRNYRSATMCFMCA